jgi:hypothetical protein
MAFVSNRPSGETSAGEEDIGEVELEEQEVIGSRTKILGFWTWGIGEINDKAATKGTVKSQFRSGLSGVRGHRPFSPHVQPHASIPHLQIS